MTETEIIDYYNEHWNDYDKVLDLLHDIIDAHEDEVKALTTKLNQRDNNTAASQKIAQLEKLLQECQDSLDEERHAIASQ